MWQVILHIPLPTAYVPAVFGLLVGVVFLLVWWLNMSRSGWAPRLVLPAIGVGMVVVYVLTQMAIQAGYMKWLPDVIPLYGFGVMLCVAFVLCVWLARIRAASEGIAPETIE